MFSIANIDASKLLASQLYDDSQSPELIITGLKSNNTQVSTSFDLENKFQTFLVPEVFNNLQAVTFSGLIGTTNFDDNLAIDNIVISVTPVPEPDSILGLLALGSLSTGLALKRRIKQKIKQSREN